MKVKGYFAYWLRKVTLHQQIQFCTSEDGTHIAYATELPAAAIWNYQIAAHAVYQWFTTFFGIVRTINAAAINDTAIQ